MAMAAAHRRAALRETLCGADQVQAGMAASSAPAVRGGLRARRKTPARLNAHTSLLLAAACVACRVLGAAGEGAGAYGRNYEGAFQISVVLPREKQKIRLVHILP